MRESLLAALAAAAILSAGMPATRAAAMTLATPSMPGTATADTAFVKRVTNVCGANGCVRVETHRVRRPPPPHH